MLSIVTSQSLKTTVLTSSRGTIYDATGKVLAQSASVWTVTLEPALISEDDKFTVADQLSKILNLSREDLLETVNKNSYFEYVARKVEDSVKEEILTMMDDYGISGGIRLISDYKRYYPYGTTASNVIGFTGTDNTGLAGIEYQYDNELTGTTGRMVSSKNGVGEDMPYQYEQYVSAEDGYDLILTIDETVQSIVEKYLQEGIEEYGVKNGATAVVMDVDTGAIIALAEGGTYDLNDPFTVYDESVVQEIDLLPEEEQSAAYNEALYNQWRNKSVSDTYYPGSVFKMVTIASALDSGAITEDTTFECTGSYIPYVDENPIGCWSSSGHGVQNARSALCNSCNPFMMQTAAAMGADTFFSYFEAFGFANKTGIDLPGEASSIYYDADELNPVELATESFGQNFSITPIQMITAAAAIANGGYLVQPHVVDTILDQDGNIVQSADTSYVRQVISEEVAATVTDYMLENATTGTGKTGNVVGYQVAGKTGTSEKIALYNEDTSQAMEYVVSYCGFAPADDPQYALLVYYDEPALDQDPSGGSMAGPTFSAIMGEILPYLGVESKISDDDYVDNIVYAPNVVGLTFAEAKERFEEIGISYGTYGESLSDTDIIEMQIPSASTSLPLEDGKVIVSKSTTYSEYDMVTVPDFEGYSVSDCRYLAAIYDLQIIISGSVNTGEELAQNQSVKAGTLVKKESVIEVAVVDYSGLE